MPAHEHRPIGRDDFVRPDGIREIWWKCACGLEEKRLFEEDECVGLKYRYGGAWMDAAALIDLTVPARFCPGCDGVGCEQCGNLGFLDGDGERIAAPVAPTPRRRRR